MSLQEAIYKMELGRGAVWLRRGFIAVALLALAICYMLAEFRGLGTAEAMDDAQLARALARGQGFTTQFVRPLALAQMRDFSAQKGPSRLLPGEKAPAIPADFFHFPDTFHAPLYPWVLSLVFRVTGTRFDLTPGQINQGQTSAPEKTIAIFGILCFWLAAALLFFLAQRLFDRRVAILSATIFLLSDLGWSFAISGLSTTWILLLLLGSFSLLHEALFAQEEERGIWNISGWIAGSAGLLGLAILSNYAVAWLLIPYGSVIAFSFPSRGWLAGAAGALVLLMFLPWGWRNFNLTGHVFGGSALLIGAEEFSYPGSTLARSYRLDAESLPWKESARKILRGVSYHAQHGYELLGASVAVIFFVAGWLHFFKRRRARILRLFIVAGSVILVLGTALIKPNPTPSSEANHLILLAPCAMMFGAAFFYVLLDRWESDLTWLRSAVVIIFVAINAAPLALTLAPPEKPVFHYPPYFPPILQLAGSWLEPGEAMMSDMPWATAWYGDRASLWLPRTLKEFYEINDFVQPVKGLLLTTWTGNAALVSEIDKGEWQSWAALIRRQNLPEGFPLPAITPLPPNDNEYLFFSDRVRWR